MIKAQDVLIKDGQFNEKEMQAYMKTSSRFGEESTTDMTKACTTLVELETMVGLKK